MRKGLIYMKENKNDLNKQVSSEQLDDVAGGVICGDDYECDYALYDNDYNYVKSGSYEELEDFARKNGYDASDMSYKERNRLYKERKAQKAKSGK